MQHGGLRLVPMVPVLKHPLVNGQESFCTRESVLLFLLPFSLSSTLSPARHQEP
jgi:hypothetical protein